VLNLLATDWFPHVEKVILVGTFLNQDQVVNAQWYESGQFDNLFAANGFDAVNLAKKSNSFVFIHGDNDPYCSVDDAKKLAGDMGAEMVVVKEGLHLSSNRKELPELLPYL
jgi:predicted alpha/beta hydrolase family esterase